VFDLDHTRRLLVDAESFGWRIHLHADELTPLGGAELAVELGALSADHLMCVTRTGIDALTASETVAVLLPGTSFFLRSDFAPARRMIEAGCAVALATDCNPGSSPTESMPAILALATLQMGLTIEEALTAATLNSAAALGRAAEIGSIEVGKRADLAVLYGASHHHLVYHYGVNPIRHVVKSGEIVVKDGRRV
jgi:imidazolonepropionase